MSHIKTSHERTIHGFVCETKLFESRTRRWWCGYITVPADHPWATEEYESIDASVHGGLSFGSEVRSPAGLLDGVQLGFDCAHFNDPEIQGDEYEAYVWRELESLAEQALAAVGAQVPAGDA